MVEDAGEGQLHSLGLLEQLRDECKSLWSGSSAAYFRVDELLRQLANPNLHDIPRNLPFRMEMWDRNEQHVHCGFGKRRGRTRCVGCGDRQLSGSAFYVAQRHTCHPAVFAFERSLRE
jgi:hypothetical protein